MLIEFTIENYRSFKESATLSLVAAKLSSGPNQTIDDTNTFIVTDKLKLLTSAAIYGANASGKSNFVSAFGFMRWFIANSSKESQADEKIDVIPFLLDVETETKPSSFEVVFCLEGITYRYGFEVTQEKVEAEWLFFSPLGQESKLFTREGDDIKSSRKFKTGKSLISFTRPNALFLSVAAQFNNEIASKVQGWFKLVGLVSGLNDTSYKNFTTNQFMTNPAFREYMLSIIRDSDVGINSVTPEKIDRDDPNFFPNGTPQELRDFYLKGNQGNKEVVSFRTSHNKKCENGQFEETFFDLADESEGTKKLFFLTGPIIDTLNDGSVIIIDEIEARLHTLLTRKIINLFNSPITNPKHAQLIFATHDTNLLSRQMLRRDQIWFIEKDEESASHLYSLAELKGIRNDRKYEADYLEGRYGGVPILGEMRNIFADDAQEEDQGCE